MKIYRLRSGGDNPWDGDVWQLARLEIKNERPWDQRPYNKNEDWFARPWIWDKDCWGPWYLSVSPYDFETKFPDTEDATLEWILEGRVDGPK